MATGEPVLLDTHTVLWWHAGGDRLSPAAAERIEEARTLLISPITCWEIGMLVRKGRVRLDRPVAPWVADLLTQRRVQDAGLTFRSAATAAGLEGLHGDPADRLLWATCRERRVPLVSKDQRLHAYAEAQGLAGAVVW